MKIKRRTEVTIVTHEITSVRIHDEADAVRGDVLRREDLLARDEASAGEDLGEEEHEEEKHDW